ncbi:MAG TPA: substrate-binding domain-containing protein [Thermoanaerobaculia bacterium]|jgi:mxaJ protein|nr:substrate-binding domain-containing protein [Thermoanaerobaculia bacterium]
MCSRFPRTAAAFVAAVLAGAAALAAATPPPGALPELRVCADPNNLPFSNRRLEGFENKIADLLARDLGARVSYTWWAQRRGFFRNTVKAGLCDVVLGVPTGMEMVATTRPYYRSTYVFVYRADRGLDLRTLDDPVLKTLRIGVQLAGDDYANTPPAHALSRRGIVANVVGFTLYGDYAAANPPARIVEAVARGEVDVAIVWGPLAGYFARRQRVPLRVVPVSPSIDPPSMPFVFDIAVGVRRKDEDLKKKIDAFLERRRPEIDAILDAYGVPRVPAAAAAPAAGGAR